MANARTVSPAGARPAADMGAEGQDNHVVSIYQPVLKMHAKAAALRSELQAAGSPQGNSTIKGHLSLQIPDTDGAPHPGHASTPANPRFKPNRLHVTKKLDEDPFTPLGRPPVVSRVKSGHSGRPSSEAGSMGAHAAGRPSHTSVGEDGGRPISPTSSIASRRSTSPNRKASVANLSARNSSPIRSSLASHEAHTALIAHAASLEAQLEAMQRAKQSLEEDVQRRQESYMRREDTLQTQITQLQTDLAAARGERSAAQDAKFGKASETIQDLHGQMVNEIEALLNKQAISIKHEEQTQTRRLKNKLSEVEAELVTERGAVNRAASEWMNRTHVLRQELDTAQGIANKLDAMYKLSEEECRRLRAQFKCQEDDREYLVRQVVGLKKENKRLAVELAAMAADAAAVSQERDDAIQAAQAQGAGVGGPGPAAWSGAGVDKETVQVKVQRYEDVIESLKKLCEAERRRTRQARAAHTAELAVRTELQSILRQCVEDVRHKSEQIQAGMQQPTMPPLPEASPSISRNASQRLPTRPGSAAMCNHLARPGSAFTQTGALWTRNASRPASAIGLTRTSMTDTRIEQMTDSQLDAGGSTASLSATERAALIGVLKGQEAMLLQLMDKAFPGVAPPSLPGNSAAMDHLVSVREARDATVVANGRALGAMRNQASASRPMVYKDATPGSEVAKEAAGRPWVFSVDAMLKLPA